MAQADVRDINAAPPLTATVVITLLFGVFGIIPAAVHSNTAAKAGLPGRPYWTAFAVSFAASIALWAVLVLVLIVGSASGGLSGLGAIGAVLVTAALIATGVLIDTADDRRRDAGR